MEMNYTFGQSVLMLYTLIEGKSLSYMLSNQEVPNNVFEFQNLFRTMLINYIENHDWLERQFLDLCLNHINDISNEKFDFLESRSYMIRK
jgi:hypothetical protein